jgi:hypothetical protein
VSVKVFNKPVKYCSKDGWWILFSDESVTKVKAELAWIARRIDVHEKIVEVKRIWHFESK